MLQELPLDADICKQLTTIDEVEKRSGLDFFNELANTDEDALESSPSSLAGRLGC